MARISQTCLSIDIHRDVAPSDTVNSVRRTHAAAINRPAGVVILRVPHVLAKLNMSRGWLYSIINPNSRYFDPTFPKKAVIGTGPRSRSVGWRLDEIDAWLDAQFNAQKGGAQ